MFSNFTSSIYFGSLTPCVGPLKGAVPLKGVEPIGRGLVGLLVNPALLSPQQCTAAPAGL